MLRKKPMNESYFEHHVETCERCGMMSDEEHDYDCSECDHEWHKGPCYFVDCECEGNHLLRESTVNDRINKCANDSYDAIYDAYVDSEIYRLRDGE